MQATRLSDPQSFSLKFKPWHTLTKKLVVPVKVLPAEKIRKRFSQIKEQIKMEEDLIILLSFCIHVENTFVLIARFGPHKIGQCSCRCVQNQKPRRKIQ
jgi:hypothetical protein